MVVSKEYTAACIRETLKTREKWLKGANLPMDTMMDDTQRKRFLKHVKERYHNEPGQVLLQKQDRNKGGKQTVKSGKHSRLGP